MSILALPGTPENVDAVGDLAYVASGHAGLQVVDVKDPRKPTIIGSVVTSGRANDVVVRGTLAYVVVNNIQQGLNIIDVSDPTKPVIIGNSRTSGGANLALSRDHALITPVRDGLEIIDITNPTNPRHIANLRIAQALSGDVALQADIAYVTEVKGKKLHIIDFSDPSTPVLLGSLSLPSAPNSVRVNGDLVYIAGGPLNLSNQSGLMIVEVSDPTNPVLLGSLKGFNASDLVVTEESAFLSRNVQNQDALPMINILNPSNPLLAGFINWQAGASPSAFSTGLDLDISRGLIYETSTGPGANNRILRIAHVLPPAETDGRIDVLARAINVISLADDMTTWVGQNVLVRPTLTTSTITLPAGSKTSHIALRQSMTLVVW